MLKNYFFLYMFFLSVNILKSAELSLLLPELTDLVSLDVEELYVKTPKFFIITSESRKLNNLPLAFKNHFQELEVMFGNDIKNSKNDSLIRAEDLIKNSKRKKRKCAKKINYSNSKMKTCNKGDLSINELKKTLAQKLDFPVESVCQHINTKKLLECYLQSSFAPLTIEQKNDLLENLAKSNNSHPLLRTVYRLVRNELKKSKNLPKDMMDHSLKLTSMLSLLLYSIDCHCLKESVELSGKRPRSNQNDKKNVKKRRII